MCHGHVRDGSHAWSHGAGSTIREGNMKVALSSAMQSFEQLRITNFVTMDPEPSNQNQLMVIGIGDRGSQSPNGLDRCFGPFFRRFATMKFV